MQTHDSTDVPGSLFLVGNSLRDLQGHYFETSIAIAEAARRRGWRVVLGTHVDCDVDLFPDWLDVFPIFRTDHWMAAGPAAEPVFAGLSIDNDTEDGPSIEDVRAGRATVAELVDARLTPAFRPRRGLPRSLLPLLRRVDRGLHRILPAAAYRWLQTSFAAARGTTRRKAGGGRIRWIVGGLMRQFGWVRRGANAVVRRARRAVRDSIRPVDLDSIRTEEQLVRELSFHTSTAREPAWIDLFERDLRRLLRLGSATARDHVLLGTAHEREMVAVRRIHDRLGPEQGPCFHLEFRHPVFQGDPHEELATRRLPQRAFYAWERNQETSRRIRFYTDTERLSNEYGVLSGLDFGVLPIPFRTDAVVERPLERTPLTLVYLGDARDEKGFHWLPGLAESLRRDDLERGRVRLRIQATPNRVGNDRSLAAAARLQEFPRDQVELVGCDGPLTPAAYDELLASADVVLLPYDRLRYRAASSGTFTEALAAGLPTVVPEGSWMADCQPAGAGLRFEDESTFVAATRRVVDDFPRLRRAAEAARRAWLDRHNPDRLVAELVDDRESSSRQRGAA